jgi:hypothetical protein
MTYKRPINKIKKYIPRLYYPRPSYSQNSAGSYSHHESDFFGIPLPNEKEIRPKGDYGAQTGLSLSNIIRYIQRHIKIEELILLGLIVLMLDESFEDDLLLIILIYILLF